MREVPEPLVPEAGALVAVRASVVSSGTEQAKVEIGAQSLISKARARPDAVRQVMNTVRREGLRAAAHVVRTRLDAPQPLGYSCAGVVEEVGANGGDLRPGERVACAGGGYAVHASVVAVPRNLIVPVPEGVSDEAAAYATVGAIALHGLRQGEVGLGQRVLVIGLGLIGQLSCQLAAVAGSRVYGLDPDQSKVDLAQKVAGTGAATSLEALETVLGRSGQGAFDVVLVTAATRSSQPIEVAAKAVRDRGRVVIVGDVGLKFERALFYEKEVEVRFSRSYGPGRYDPVYEELGIDYPVGYVRWTVQRNMQAFLEACEAGRVDPVSLTTHRFPVTEAPSAYKTLLDPSQPTVGVVLEYPTERTARVEIGPSVGRQEIVVGALGVGVVGTGRFATRTLLPTLRDDPDVALVAVSSERGLNAAEVAESYGATAVGGIDEVLEREDVKAVVIATRHDSHAALVARALREGRHVFVEKPLVRVEEELDEVLDAFNESGRVCMVGFNRRYAPATVALRDELASLSGPSQILIRVNAGALPGHWLTDPEVGGGRLVGEVCHFVDLAAHLVGSPAGGVISVGVPTGAYGPAGWESVSLSLDYPDGSTATIVYSALGDAGLPKERVEVHRAGISLVIDDFRRWEFWRDGKRRTGGSRVPDKGHRAELAAFVAACQGKPSPASFPHDVATTVTTFAALRSLGSGRRVEVPKVDIDV
ncbi:MAG: bi-domain-containing oxidoreductase [Acidimicrobiia bacterium]